MRKWSRIFVISTVFLLVMFLVNVAFAEQKEVGKPSLLVQAASMNQHGQGETNRLNLPDREGADKPSFNRSIPQSENMSSTSVGEPKFEKSEVIQKTKKLQIPFIANNGQTDERINFYANTFGGTVFVTKDGEIVYALPNNSSDVETQCLASLMHSSNGTQDNHVSDIMHPASWIVDHDKSEFQNPKSTNSNSKNLKFANPKSAIQNLSSTSIGDLKSRVALREQFVNAKVKTIQGEQPSVTKVNYFKGNDPSKWKSNISTYDIVNLGEIYKGIDLKLKAYGDNVEKLFYVKPGADPDQIKIRLSGIQPPESPFIKGDLAKSPLEKGARGLSVNEHGELEVETELGPLKFTKPIVYQEINGKRVEVEVEYRIQESESNPKSTNSDSRNLKSEIQNPQFVYSNPKSKIANRKLEYGFRVAFYDKTKDLIIDPLLASTFLGGSSYNYANSITIDSEGNVYVTGNTSSSDFPTTTGAYDTSFNGSDSYGGDTFISKLNGDLTSLLASTYLGGSNSDYANSIAIDSGGNIYVAGWTRSADFPTIGGAYDTFYNGGDYGGDAFISKLNGDLTGLIASTYLGGSGSDYSYSMAIGSEGLIYVTGHTESSDFPTTTGAFMASYNGGYNDAFVSCLNGDLTSLIASTYLGGINGDGGHSMAIDSGGNIYVSGWTTSLNFPTTTDAYDISYNYTDYGIDYDTDVFVSKLSEDLTDLLASTYLGGSSQEVSVNSIAIDSGGNIYVAGSSWSSNFPTTPSAYDTSYTYNGQAEAYVSKLNGDLTNLLASTYLGGSSSDYTNSIAIDSGGNIYVTGYTGSSDFPTTTGAYDTSYNGDAFVSKLSGDLTSLLASTYLGGSNSDYSDYTNSITIDSGGNIYVAGYTYSIDFPATTGAYDTAYNGDENFINDAFVSRFDSNLSAGGDVVPAPTPSPRPSNSPPPIPTVISLPTPVPTPTTEPIKKYIISGYVVDKRGNPVESAKIRLKGANSKVLKKTVSNEDGLFEFTDLDADTYTITAIKKGYKRVKQTVILEAGEEKDIEIVMKKTRKKTRETILQ